MLYSFLKKQVVNSFLDWLVEVTVPLLVSSIWVCMSSCIFTTSCQALEKVCSHTSGGKGWFRIEFSIYNYFFVQVFDQHATCTVCYSTHSFFASTVYWMWISKILQFVHCPPNGTFLWTFPQLLYTNLC